MASIYKIASGWRAQVRMKDKPTTSQVFPSKREAQLWAREQEERLHKSTSSNPFMTYGALHDEYITAIAHPKHSKRFSLKHLRAYWGDWRVCEMKSAAFSNYATLRRREVGPATVLQELIYLKVVLHHGGVLTGCDETHIATAHLGTTMKTLRHTRTIGEANKRTRRPTEKELQALEEYWLARPVIHTPFMDLVLFAICTCARKGEIVGPGGAVWEDLSVKDRTLWLRGRKDPKDPAGHDDQIPLLAGPVTFRGNIVDPLEIALRQPTSHRRTGRIFPYAECTVDAGFRTACRALKIQDLRFHDLRHDGISRLFESDYDIPKVASVSGHRSWENLKRYTHLRPDTVHRETSPKS